MRQQIRTIRILTNRFEEAEELEDRIELMKEIEKVSKEVSDLLQLDYMESITNYRNIWNVTKK